jgi:hypothetical protein
MDENAAYAAWLRAQEVLAGTAGIKDALKARQEARQMGGSDFRAREEPPLVHPVTRPRDRPRDWGAEQAWVERISEALIQRHLATLLEAVGQALATVREEIRDEVRVMILELHREFGPGAAAAESQAHVIQRMSLVIESLDRLEQMVGRVHRTALDVHDVTGATPN